MAELFANNASSTLASSIIAGDGSLTVATGEGVLFPSPSGGDYFHATLDDGTNVEIVRVTARSTDTLTIVRAQQGTSAAGFAAGTPVQLRITAGSLARFEAPHTVSGITGFATGAAAGDRDYYERAGGDPLTGIDWTISAMFSAAAEASGEQRIVGTLPEFVNAGAGMTWDGNTITVYWYDGADVLRSVSVVPDDSFSRTHHVVFVYSNGNGTLYVDGRFAAFTAGSAGAVFTPGGAFAVGGSSGGAGATNGATQTLIHGASFALANTTQTEMLAWYRACLTAHAFVPNPTLPASQEAWSVVAGVNPNGGAWTPVDGANNLVRTGSAGVISEATIPLRW